MKFALCGCDAGPADAIELALRLRWPDAEVSTVGTGCRALETARENNADLILVDTALLRADSLELLTTIRARFAGALVVLAHQASEKEMLEVLDAGADDYLPTTITASPVQLFARICAVLRRAGSAARPEVVANCGALAVDLERHQAHVAGRELYLTPTEFKLLYELARNSGKLVTQEALHKLVWGCEEKLYIDCLRKHIQRLRKKIGNAADSQIQILSIHGVGYRLSELPLIVAPLFHIAATDIYALC